MKVEDIIKAVRWCIDEESNNFSSITDEKDDLYMDNIIKAKSTMPCIGLPLPHHPLLHWLIPRR